MNLKKELFAVILVFVVIFSLIPPAFAQVKPGKNIVASGVIDLVSRDKKLNADYMMIDERKIFLSANTKIVDEWGNLLTVKDLKPGLTAVVEAIRISERSYETQIAVKK